MDDLAFWGAVESLRTENVSTAWFLMDAWFDERRPDEAEETFTRLVVAWIRVTPSDRDVLLDSAFEQLIGPPLRADAMAKWDRLCRMTDRLEAATRHREPS